MPYNQIYAIAAQALTAEKMRVDLVANNIANQHNVQPLGHPVFQVQQLVTKATPFNEFITNNAATGIGSMELLAENLPPNLVYQPNHPAANDKGYVTYPGINTIDEMTTLIRASRAYEANIKIINSAHNLYLHALSIGEER